MTEAPPLIVRFPVPGDFTGPFEAIGALRGRVSVDDFIRHHDARSGQYTFVAELEGHLVGVATTTVDGPSLHIDFLARNGSNPMATGRRIGMPLMTTVEDFASRLGVRIINFESVDDPDAIAFYRRCGFTAAGAPFEEPGWGLLHPMEKAVSRRP